MSSVLVTVGGAVEDGSVVKGGLAAAGAAVGAVVLARLVVDSS